MKKKTRVIKESTSKSINSILRKVVTHKDGTTRLANIFGYEVSGKTGLLNTIPTKIKILTHLYHILFRTEKNVLLIMLDDPKIARDLIYDYNGFKIKV